MGGEGEGGGQREGKVSVRVSRWAADGGSRVQPRPGGEEGEGGEEGG